MTPPPPTDDSTAPLPGLPGRVVRVSDPHVGQGDPFMENLADFLLFLVPLMLAEMREWTPEQRARNAVDTATIIASHGDDALYGGRHQGPARTAIARALALGAYSPGGITQFAVHACLHDHPDCTATR
ncbi:MULTISPECIES: hypothetical protein [Nocardia]|uniref:hypothetical protein n=1 Tax=Nocardia TaxID=1817 RepID=UPI000D68CBD9|nr:MULTISPECIES: hypothetical protein [Nocardia]